MRNRNNISKSNVRLARATWGDLPKAAICSLRTLSEEYSLSVAHGDLQILDGRWYVTNSGLLRMALRSRCLGINTTVQTKLSAPAANRWVFKAVVHKSTGSRGFVGYGDADPSNVSSLVHGAEMRVAETRAVNRALRKAYGIGLCSVEELGWSPRHSSPDRTNQSALPANGNNRHPNGQRRLRDQLCLLIRKHQLDASLVKAYAADYCGTPALRDANRSQIESFITHLTEWSDRDRDSLLCKLNSYGPSQEVRA
jgi:hypothetical protein